MRRYTTVLVFAAFLLVAFGLPGRADITAGYVTNVSITTVAGIGANQITDGPRASTLLLADETPGYYSTQVVSTAYANDGSNEAEERLEIWHYRSVYGGSTNVDYDACEGAVVTNVSESYSSLSYDIYAYGNVTAYTSPASGSVMAYLDILVPAGFHEISVNVQAIHDATEGTVLVTLLDQSTQSVVTQRVGSTATNVYYAGDLSTDYFAEAEVKFPVSGGSYTLGIRHEQAGAPVSYSDYSWSAYLQLLPVSQDVGGDFSGDGATDLALYSPSNPLEGLWHILFGTFTSACFDVTYSAPLLAGFDVQWGWSGALPVSGDFLGDYQSDVAVYSPANGTWYILNYSLFSGPAARRRGPFGGLEQQAIVMQWGWSEALPVPADFDGDGKADLAVFYAAAGTWYIRNSRDGSARVENYGWNGAVPVPADYDGDGVSDLAVYDPATGDWYYKQSSDGAYVTRNWGWSEADPVPGDYDGDGKCDLAVYHPDTGDWYISQSSNGEPLIRNWGWAAAVPVPGDYDADGLCDVAVYASANGAWYGSMSGNGSYQERTFAFSEAQFPVNCRQYLINRYFGISP